MTLVLENNTSSAESIAKRLRDDICGLGLEPGTRLQPLRELAVRYDTSYITARKAINILCRQGLLDSRRGAGIYVRKDEYERTDNAIVANKTIAMLFCGLEQHVITNSIYSRLLYGVEKEADLQGFNVVISLLKSLDSFHKNEIFSSSAGFLALGTDIAGLQSLFAGKVFVWVMGADKAWGDQVSYNNKSVGELAAKTLLLRGHKHLATVNVDPLVGRQRCDTFSLYASQGGATVDVYDDTSAFIKTRFEEHIDQSVMHKWVDQMVCSDPMPTGVFVVDMAADSLYNALLDKGIRPGKDIEMITCNSSDVPAFRTGYTPLNIDIFADEIGAMAVRHLKWRLGNDKSKRVVVKVEPSLDTEG